MSAPPGTRSLCQDLAANAKRIAELWNEAIEQEPWILPRGAAQPEFVPQVVHAIAGAAVCSPPTRASVLALADVAARHATQRATSGATHDRVVLEYYLLRNAMWSYFRERPAATEADVRVILVVDLTISIATRAALLGFYRSELEAQQRWADALHLLVDEVPLIWEERE